MCDSKRIFFVSLEKKFLPEISFQKILNKILQKKKFGTKKFSFFFLIDSQENCETQQICRISLPKNPTK